MSVTLKKEVFAADERKKMNQINYYMVPLTMFVLFVLTVRLGTAVTDVESAKYVGCALILSLVYSDFCSGLLHWSFDNFGTADTPILGKKIIRPFRVHHDDPIEICSHDVIEANGNTCMASLPPLFLLAAAYTPVEGEHVKNALFGAVLIFWAGTAFINQFHIWSHKRSKDLPFLVDAMQKFGLLLSRAGHNVHHTSHFRTYYSLITGWSNPILYYLNGYAVLEWFVRVFFGAEPYTVMEERAKKRDGVKKVGANASTGDEDIYVPPNAHVTAWLMGTFWYLCCILPTLGCIAYCFVA